MQSFYVDKYFDPQKLQVLYIYIYPETCWIQQGLKGTEGSSFRVIRNYPQSGLEKELGISRFGIHSFYLQSPQLWEMLGGWCRAKTYNTS